MANTIITKNSSTASAVPAAGSLTQGELAVNVTDKKLYTKNSGGSVVEITPTAIQGTTTAAIPTSALASGTADSSKVLLGDRTWGTLSGGVSSLNGETGAITNTALASIGNTIVGIRSGHSNTGSGFTLNATYTSVIAFGVTSGAGATGTSTQPGTWRHVSGIAGVYVQGGPQANMLQGLFVRIS